MIFFSDFNFLFLLYNPKYRQLFYMYKYWILLPSWGIIVFHGHRRVTIFHIANQIFMTPVCIK